MLSGKFHYFFFFEPFPKVSEEFFRVASQLIICFGKGLLFLLFWRNYPYPEGAGVGKVFSPSCNKF